MNIAPPQIIDLPAFQKICNVLHTKFEGNKGSERQQVQDRGKCEQKVLAVTQLSRFNLSLSEILKKKIKVSTNYLISINNEDIFTANFTDSQLSPDDCTKVFFK